MNITEPEDLQETRTVTTITRRHSKLQEMTLMGVSDPTRRSGATKRSPSGTTPEGQTPESVMGVGRLVTSREIADLAATRRPERPTTATGAP